MDNPWKIIAIVFMILFAATTVICVSGVSFSDAAKSSLMSGSAPNATANAEIATNFIQTNLVGYGTSVRLVSVTEESGLYRLSLNVRSADKQEQTLYVFMSKDGKYLFPSTFMVSQFLPSETSKIPAPAASSANACNSVTTAESPILEAFVVTYCPYGTQMQVVLADIVAKIPDLSKNIKVRYIGDITNGKVQSMHGSTEATENLRQICIREEQPAAYWKYVSCFISSHQTDTCQKTAGVDITQITGCTNDTTRGLKYAGEDFTRSSSYGATASPTLILNGVRVSEFNFGGRSPEGVKSLLCCGFSTQPEGCGISLASSQVLAGSAGQC